MPSCVRLSIRDKLCQFSCVKSCEIVSSRVNLCWVVSNCVKYVALSNFVLNCVILVEEKSTEVNWSKNKLNSTILSTVACSVPFIILSKTVQFLKNLAKKWSWSKLLLWFAKLISVITPLFRGQRVKVCTWQTDSLWSDPQPTSAKQLASLSLCSYMASKVMTQPQFTNPPFFVLSRRHKLSQFCIDQ